MARVDRAAFSLIEVLLATSILMGSLVVLQELARLGRRHAVDAEETATAQALARTRLSEILAGAAPLKSAETAALDEAPGWVCTVGVEPIAALGVTEIVVTVAKDDSSPMGGTPLAGGSSSRVASRGKGRSFTLIQWVRAFSRGGQIGPPTRPSPDATRRFAARDVR